MIKTIIMYYFLLYEKSSYCNYKFMKDLKMNNL